MSSIFTPIGCICPCSRASRRLSSRRCTAGWMVRRAAPCLREFGWTPVVSVSDAQRKLGSGGELATGRCITACSAGIADAAAPGRRAVTWLFSAVSRRRSRPMWPFASHMASGRRIRLAAKIEAAELRLLPGQDPTLARLVRASSSWARSARRRRRSSWATRRRSCSRSREPEPFGMVHDRGRRVRHARDRVRVRLGA